MVRYAGETSPGKGCCVVGQTGRAEAGDDAEAEVEGSDDNSGGEAHSSEWDAEVGDEPERSGVESWDDTGNEGFEIGLGEAVEEEVGHDEVVGASGCEGKRGDVVGLQARGGATFA